MYASIVTSRLHKIRDPRTPGFFWYEIEGRDPASGATWCAAICDTRDEAIEKIDGLREAAERKGGAA
jgi:hypothetical protein